MPSPGSRFVILPELAIARRADLAASGTLDVPIVPSGAVEVLGSGFAWSRENRLANMAWAPDNRGAVLDVHLKRVLAPGGERPVFGLLAGMPFGQGSSWDVLAVGSHWVPPLICIEVLDRGWVATAHARGADIVAVLADDRPLMGSRVAQEQANAIARLRSVESGLKVVRASLGGVAMAFWPDGWQEA